MNGEDVGEETISKVREEVSEEAEEDSLEEEPKTTKEVCGEEQVQEEANEFILVNEEVMNDDVHHKNKTFSKKSKKKTKKKKDMMKAEWTSFKKVPTSSKKKKAPKKNKGGGKNKSITTIERSTGKKKCSKKEICIMNQAESFAMKLPITFPSLISSILIKKKSDILNTEDISSVNLSSLKFSYRLFDGNHLPDNVLPKIQNFDLTYLTIEGNFPKVPPMSGTAKSHVLQELMQVSKTLHDVISTSTVRKNKVDDLIKLMNPKVF
ncbi:hypothetical protein KIW84_076278 [Lathyrus oleraceus]|uniref:Uncharacterized protein n=1 Tax=Pisum sativum TaxID=3888 RepID=A0A9D4VW51_PEA|nr:hypothetical protein KIW84_076278 [Pisum sativum]